MRLRPLLSRFHLVAGLSAGAVVAVVGTTGSLLAFRDEIDRTLNPGLFQAASGERELASPQAVVDAALAAHPGQKAVRLTYPPAPGESFRVALTSGTEVFLTPQRVRVVGERDAAQALVSRVLEAHESLFAGDLGKEVVRWSVLVLLLLLLSGWGIRMRVQGAPWRHLSRPNGLSATVRESHQLTGLTLGSLVAISALTGTIFAFKPQASWLVGAPALPEVSSSSAPAAPTIGLDQAVAVARARFPEATVVMLRLPKKPADVLRVDLRQPGEAHPNGRTFVYLDRASGAVLAVVDPRAQGWGWRVLNEYNFPIHTGVLGGWPHRLLMPVIGLTPLAMFASGLWLWRGKRRKRPRPT